MNTKWYKTVTGAFLAAALIANIPAGPAYADGLQTEQSAPAASISSYALTPSLQAEVKSVISDKTASGNRIGVVVKLENTGSRVTRVPDYELRVQTAEGIGYTLTGSVSNAKAVLPKSKAELSYMLELNAEGEVELNDLVWVKINDYVYPREETVVLSVPVAGLVWKGPDAVIEEPASVKKWGEAFRLPLQSKSLEFTPQLILSDNTNAGPVTLVTLLAENKSERTETVPAFALDGRSDNKTYPGRLVETNTVLKPGEKKSLHVVIPSDKQAVLKSLQVVTPESYVKLGLDAKPEIVQYTVGRLGILLPNRSVELGNYVTAYQKGDKMVFDPYSKLVDDQLNVSLQELTLNGNESDGYQTVMAKLIFRNESSRPLDLPSLGMELSSPDGYTYTGVRQTAAAQQLMPHLSYVVNYSFTVPASETGEKLILMMTDNQIVQPYGVPVAAYQVAAEPSVTTDKSLSFFPYTVNVNYKSIAYLFNTNTLTYTYQLKLDLDIKKQEDVVVDGNSSYMLIELVDGLDRVLGSERFSFTGPKRLVSGSQTLSFGNLNTDQAESNLTTRIYEAVQTPNGEVKRLLKVMK